MQTNPKKILLIRFSSFGDVVQTLSVVAALKHRWPEAEIHWVTRSEFTPLIENHPNLYKTWSLDKKQGLKGLFLLAKGLHTTSFDRVYDAHNNLRSLFLGFYLFSASLLTGKTTPLQLRRSIRRWKRFLLFKLGIDLFEKPFSGQRDLLEPLRAWGIAKIPPKAPQLFLNESDFSAARKYLPENKDYVALAASAAFELKRWPLAHWKTLLQSWLTQDKELHFVLLGGPEDTFINELVTLDSNRIHNLAGKLKLAESAAVVKHSRLLIANDTGLLHVGEQLGHPTIALMGPAPFGFPCRRETTHILELELDCRPCSKHGQGPCRNPKYHWCMQGISPDLVLQIAQTKLNSSERKTAP